MATTPNYDMYLSSDSDSMNDVDQSLNNQWGIITGIVRPKTIVASLPITDFTYVIGDRIYHSSLQSMFVLIAQNSAWGNFWQPIQTHYGPWIQPGSTVLADASIYKFGDTPLEYRITNTGKFIFRGSVDTVASTGYLDWEGNSTPPTLTNIPTGISPGRRQQFEVAPYPQASPSAKPIVAKLLVWPDGHFTNTVWNPNNNATSLFLDGVEWHMGYGNGYGPNN